MRHHFIRHFAALPRPEVRLRGWRVKYLTPTLWSGALGLAALLSYAISTYDIPVSILVLSCIFSACAVLLPGLWSWYQRVRLDRTVGALIRAAEQISRGELYQAVVSTNHERLAPLERAFENMRLALRSSTYTRNYLHSVLNGMTDAVFVTAPGGVVRMANDAACRMTGYSEKQLIGMQPAYGLFDVSGSIEKDGMQFQLLVNNVLDRRAQLSRFEQCLFTFVLWRPTEIRQVDLGQGGYTTVERLEQSQ